MRAVRTLEPAWLSLLSDRRRHRPSGREGGSDGRCGANYIDEEEVGPKASRELGEGSVVEVRTPGGGGWGKP
jgi:N-methylhydantoinase B